MSNVDDKIKNRVQLLKGGFKRFVTPTKLPMSAETKWNLEIVCLNTKPQLHQDQNSISVFDRAKFYLDNHLYSMQTNINTNKQNWIAAMRNS